MSQTGMCVCVTRIKHEAEKAQTVPAQDLCPGSRQFGHGGLLDLEVMCGTEMPTMSFEFVSISHQGHSIVLLLPDIRNVLGKS